MAIERSGFFNSKIVDGVRDRKYDATDYAEYFSTFISDGVFINPVNQLQVISNGGMNIVIKSGKAFIEGYWYYLDEDKEIELPVNTMGKEMNIKIVVSLNRADRVITSSYEVGSTLPVNDGTKHELVIATIVVPASVTSITDANITDRRKEEQYCGFVTTLVKGVDIEPLFLQMDAQFQEWFESIRGQLSEDAAGNLQLQIGNLEELSTETKESIVLAINEVYEKAKKGSRDMIGDEYNPKNSYAVGEYCIHDNKMQKCKTPTSGTPEAPEKFDQAKWDVVTIAGELREQNVKMTDYVLIRQFSKSMPSVPANGAASFQIPISIPEGYKRVGIIRAWVADSLMFVFNAFMSDSKTVSCDVRNLSNTEIKNAMCYVQILFQKT